jgi:hypothetical protein
MTIAQARTIVNAFVLGQPGVTTADHLAARAVLKTIGE